MVQKHGFHPHSSAGAADWFDFCNPCKSCLRGDWAALEEGCNEIMYTLKDNVH